MKVVISATDAIAQQNASKKLSSLLAQYHATPILLLLSGGSALSILDKSLATNLTNKTTICVLDERYTTDPNINNFAQLKNTAFFQQSVEKGVGIIDTLPRANDSIQDLEKHFEISLHVWVDKNKNGRIITTLGIGKDSHTSGIMPFPENETIFKNLFEGKRWVVSYDAGAKSEHRFRITTTLTFLRIITAGVIFAVGEDKKSALRAVLHKNTNLYKYPARVLNELENTFLYTDQKV